MRRLSRLLARVYWTLYLALHILGQARYPFRSPARIARDGDRRARRMVAYAYRWVPYYRETLDRLGLTPADFRTVDDLRRLPLISAADLQADPERFRSTQYRLADLLDLSSSGSTGRPHTIWHHRAMLYLNIAHGEREMSMLRRIIGKGYRLRAMIPTNTLHTHSSRSIVRAHALLPSRADMWQGKADHPIVVDDPPEVMLAALNARRPDIFYGYGSVIANLFAYAHEHGLDVHRPAVVRYAADALPPAARRLLNEVYGVQVFSAYQSIELFRTGFECEAHRGYHINSDLYPLRVIDEHGEDCPPGVEGEIVGSNLVNRATVLLNYRMGDLAAWLDGPCPCGRHLPMLSFIVGRTVDDLYDTAGRRLYCSRAVAPIRALAGVYQYQIVQYALDHLQINLIVSAECDRGAAIASLTAKLQAQFGTDMRVEVRFVDEIERTAAGKVRYVRNLIDGSTR
jgi:phenylacetate-CoA ligase